jgi:hypothetical protein
MPFLFFFFRMHALLLLTHELVWVMVLLVFQILKRQRPSIVTTLAHVKYGVKVMKYSFKALVYLLANLCIK